MTTMDNTVNGTVMGTAADEGQKMRDDLYAEEDCRIYTMKRKDWEGEHLRMRYFSGKARTFEALYRANDEEALNAFVRRTYMEPEGKKHLLEGICLVVLNYASKHFTSSMCMHAGVSAEDIAMSMFTEIAEKLPSVVSAESPRRYLQKIIRLTFRSAVVSERDFLDPIRTTNSALRPAVNLALSGKTRAEMKPEDQELYDRIMRTPRLRTVYASAWQQRFPVCLSSPVPDGGEDEVTYADVITAPCSDPLEILCSADQTAAAEEVAANIEDPLRRAVFLACVRGLPLDVERITARKLLENGEDYCRDVLGLSGRKRIKLLREALRELAEACGYGKRENEAEDRYPA